MQGVSLHSYLLFEIIQNPWLSAVNILQEKSNMYSLREHHEKKMNSNVSNTFPKAIPSSEPSTNLITHCPVVICWTHCQEGSKFSTKDRTSLSIQLKSVYNRKCTSVLSKKISLKFPSHLSLFFGFTTRSLDTATRQETNHFMHLALHKNDESFLWENQVSIGPKI